MLKAIFVIIFAILLANEVDAQNTILLYPDSILGSKGELTTGEQPIIEIYLPLNRIKDQVSVVVFPGGAYSFLAWQEEGVIVAKAFAERGIVAFVVKYRLPKTQSAKDKAFVSLMDAQQAMKIVRSRAEEWGLNPSKIGVIGYSAGGHLASTLGTHFTKSYIQNKENVSLRPDFMILVYPVISMRDELTHMGSRISLLGIEPSEEKIDLFSNELQVTKDTPPTYLTHAGDDRLVDVNNSIVFYQALQKNGVDAELHLLPKGNHGFTQRLPVNEWLEPMLEFLKREGPYK